MPFFNYELAAPDQSAWDSTFDQGGTMYFECRVECDGFAGVAKVELEVSESDRALEEEDGDGEDACQESWRASWEGWHLGVESRCWVELALDGLGQSIKIETDDYEHRMNCPLEGFARDELARAMNEAVNALAATPAYKEMMASKDLAHVMRIEMEQGAAAPKARPRSL